MALEKERLDRAIIAMRVAKELPPAGRSILASVFRRWCRCSWTTRASFSTTARAEC